MTARLGSTQFRHGETIFFIAYTADGKHLLTAGRDNAIILWDRTTGREVRRFERAAKKELLEVKPVLPMAMMPGRMGQPGASDFPVALSPDGKTLAAGKDSTLTIWEVASGKKLHELTAAVPVFDLVFGTFRNPKADEPREAGFYTGASARIGEMLAFRPVA